MELIKKDSETVEVVSRRTESKEWLIELRAEFVQKIKDIDTKLNLLK